MHNNIERATFTGYNRMKIIKVPLGVSSVVFDLITIPFKFGSIVRWY